MINHIKNKIYQSIESIQQKFKPLKIPKSYKNKFFKEINSKSASSVNSVRNHEEKIVNNSNILIDNSRIRRRKDKRQQTETFIKQIPDGILIKGKFVNSKLHGQIQIQYFNGNKFKGHFQNGIKNQGLMIFSHAQCQYQGGFCGEKFANYGKLTYYNGRIIEGQWQNLHLVGQATITYPNNDVYYGQVNQNLYKDGQGYLFFRDGSKYVGTFKQGSITGIGTYYKNNQIIAKGIWHKGKLVKQIFQNQQTTLIENLCDQNLILEINNKSKQIQKKPTNIKQKQHDILNKKTKQSTDQYLLTQTQSINSYRTILKQKTLIKQKNYKNNKRSHKQRKHQILISIEDHF